MLALKTVKMPWIRLPLFLDATDASGKSAAAVGARDLTALKLLTTYFVYKEVPTGINTLETRFLGITSDDDMTIDVHAGRLNAKNEADMVRVCTLTIKIGTQVTDDATYTKYADTITITNNDWIKTVSSMGIGAEQQARLVFDLCGYDVIGFYGYSTFDADLAVEISGY